MSRLLESVMAHVQEGIAVFDREGTVLYVNPFSARFFGSTPDALIGGRLFEMFPHAKAQPFHGAFLRVAAGGPAESFEHYFAPGDAWYANRIEALDGNVLVMARDVTEHVRRRRSLETIARISGVLTAAETGPREAARSVAQILGEVLEARCAVLLASDALPADSPQAGPRALSVPLIAGDEVLGLLTAVRPESAPPLGPDHRQLAAEVAPSIGLFLAQAARRAEVRRVNERMMALGDAIPALVAFVGPDERYHYVNATYEQWFGLPKSRFLGTPLRDIFGPEPYRMIEPHVRRALAGETVRFRSRLGFTPEAREVDARYLPIAGTGQRVEGFVVLVEDVTPEAKLAALEREQRDAAHRALRRLENLLAVTGRLAGAARAEEIATVVVDQAVDALEATMAGMWTLSPGADELVLLRQRGFLPEHAEAFAKMPLSAGGPIPDALRRLAPVWIRSRAEYAASYPDQEIANRPASAPPLAFACLPLVIEGRPAGCVAFAFHDETRLTAEERTFLEVLARHAAEALRRARLYAQLRDASETSEALIDASPSAIILLDQRAVVHTWNHAAERIFGWKAEEVLGKPLPYDDADLVNVFANLKRVFAGETLVAESIERKRRNGERFEAEVYAAPVALSDGRVMCISVVNDVTERRRIDKHRRMVAEASTLFARSLDLAQTLAEVLRVPLAGLADWCALDLRKEDGTLERHARSRDGAKELSARGMRGAISQPLLAGGRNLGTITVASREREYDDWDIALLADVAERAATAIENARLFEAARSARQDAEAANRAKDQFLAMLGHELRNPLAPMTIALDLMKARGPGQLEKERAVIERQVAHLSRLVDDLLDVSRITRGKIELRRERVALAETVAKAVELTSPLLEGSRHQLAVDVAPDLLVDGDPTRLGQIVANLLSNAAKYTQPGGRIEVRGARRGEDVELVVKDDGVGIAPDLLPRVFDLFVQGPQDSARTSGGMGLGLAIVKSLVVLHGGTVTARSDGAGRGTEMRVLLPAASAEVILDARAPGLTTGDLAPQVRRILVVDDNEDAATLLAEALDDRGHRARAAFDGPSALRIAQDLEPEIAILDIGLPVMDGYELAERLRQHLAAVRLIALTGYGQASDRARARAAGFDAHFAKPVRVEDLLAVIEG